MSIRLRFYNFIIPKSILEEKFDGGLIRFKENVPNQTFQEDNDLVSVGFMGPVDVDWFCNELKKKGLNFTGKSSKDFTVTNSIFGNLWDVEWLDRDVHHCWLKGSLPTHTNIVKLRFKQHKILDASIPENKWWNSLDDIWKNVLYQNLKYDTDDKEKRLHSLFSFGYNLEFIGEITNEDVKQIIDLKTIWMNAISSDELKNINDIGVLSRLRNIRSLTLKNTSIDSLSGVESLTNLEFIDIDGNFSNIENLSNLKKLRTLNLRSKNIESIKSINSLNLKWLNINNGKIPNPTEFENYKKMNPNCVIYYSYN